MADRRTKRRLRAASLLVATPLLAYACGPGGGSGGSGGTAGGGTAGASGASGAAGFAGSTGGTAGAASGGQGGSAGGGAGGADGSITGGTAGAAGNGTGGTGGVVSVFCGDGIRGLDEECDDGNASNDDACTTDCYVNDFLAAGLGPTDAGVPLPGRYLGVGRHPVAAGVDGFAVAHVSPTPSPAVGLSAFAPSGAPLAPKVVVSTGVTSSALLFSDPVLAALPGGKYATAWTDFGGDGDELGVALRVVDPLVPPVGEPSHANATTDFAQFDPDILWTGTTLVVAWSDDSNATTGPDIRYRTFSPTLVAAESADQTLSADAGTDSAVSLARFAGSWAAAWRHAETGGKETIRIQAGNTSWSVGPHTPGATSDKPALVELDGSTLLVVFTEGSSLRGSILGTSTPGSTAAFTLEPPGTTLEQSQPNATSVGSRIFIAWRSALEPGNPLAEDTWLREATFSNGTLTLADPFPLPRCPVHRDDDQRFPALAASPLAPEGALVTAWDDYGLTFGAGEGAPDVVVELIPTPVLRKPAPDGGGA